MNACVESLVLETQGGDNSAPEPLNSLCNTQADMAADGWSLPDQWSDGILDEKGEKMSKRSVTASLVP